MLYIIRDMFRTEVLFGNHTFVFVCIAQNFAQTQANNNVWVFVTANGGSLCRINQIL